MRSFRSDRWPVSVVMIFRKCDGRSWGRYLSSWGNSRPTSIHRISSVGEYVSFVEKQKMFSLEKNQTLKETYYGIKVCCCFLILNFWLKNH